jgi:hypothetical protein
MFAPELQGGAQLVDRNDSRVHDSNGVATSAQACDLRLGPRGRLRPCEKRVAAVGYIDRFRHLCFLPASGEKMERLRSIPIPLWEWRNRELPAAGDGILCRARLRVGKYPKRYAISRRLDSPSVSLLTRRLISIAKAVPLVDVTACAAD